MEFLEDRRVLANTYLASDAKNDWNQVLESDVGKMVSSILTRHGQPLNVVNILMDQWYESNIGFLIESDKDIEIGFQVGIGGEVDPDFRPTSRHPIDFEAFTGYTITRTIPISDEPSTWTLSRGFEVDIAGFGFAGEYFATFESLSNTSPESNQLELGVRIAGSYSEGSEKDFPLPGFFRIEASFDVATEYTFEARTKLTFSEIQTLTDQSTRWQALADIFVPYIGNSWFQNVVYGALSFTPVLDASQFSELLFPDTPMGILLQQGAAGAVEVQVDEGFQIQAGATLAIGPGVGVAHAGIQFNVSGAIVATETIYGPTLIPAWSFGDSPAASSADIAGLLKNESITGATVIVHGLQLPLVGSGDALEPLSKAILRRNGGILVDYDIRGNGAEVGFAKPRFISATNGAQNKELVLQFDWKAESNNNSAGWVEAAADRLFAMLVEFNVVDLLLPSQSLPLHFIGHSFGAAVVSEVTERLASYSVEVDHVTYLDPHDFDQAFLPIDGNQNLFELGQPDGYGASRFQNVTFMDAYYQTSNYLLPNGRPIPGAYNYYLESGQHLPEFANNHTFVWKTFYLGTVLGGQPYGEPQPVDWDQWTDTGYVYSRRVPESGPRRTTAAPVFFDEHVERPQSHVYSESWIVDQSTGLPNNAELNARGLVASDITNASWPPEVDQLAIYNGNFDFQGNSDGIPGWGFQGGGGLGYIERANANNFLTLRQNKVALQHNSLVIPPSATGIQFDLKVVVSSPDDLLIVDVAGHQLAPIRLGLATSEFRTGALSFPDDLSEEFGQLEFRLISPIGQVTSIVNLDNIRFLAEVPPMVADAGGDYRVAEGGTIILDGSRSTTGQHADAGVTYLWDLDGDGEFGEQGTDAHRGDELGVRPTLVIPRSDSGPAQIPIALQLLSNGLRSLPGYSAVTLENAPPYGIITGPSVVFAGQSVTYHAIVADYSDEDAAAFRPRDWEWTVTGASQQFSGTGTLIDFTPTVREELEIRITVHDKDEGTTTLARIINLDIASSILAPLDVRIDNVITTPGQRFLYRLDGDAGRKLTLSAYWGYRNTYFGVTDGGLVEQGSMRLIGPEGSILAAPAIDRYSQGTGTQTILHHFSSLNDFVLPQTGTYFVEVSGLSQTVGSFSLGINDPLENFQTLSQSVPTTTVFGVRGDIQEWSFSANAGQAVGWTYQGDVPIRSWSISSGTNIVAQGAGGSIVTMAFTPTSSGTYYLRFEDDTAPLLNSPGVIGPFAYILTPASPAPLDVRIDSSIAVPKNTYLYRLDGDTGRRLTLSAYWGYRNTYFGVTDGGLVEQGSMRLIGPDGSILAAPPIDRYSQGSGTQTILHHFSSLNDFVLPQTGTYFVEVSGLSQTVGSFSLGINNPLENFQTLSQSVPTTTAFGVRGDIQEWSFAATAGQAVGWTYQGEVPIRSWSISSSTGIVAQGAGGSIVTMAFTPTSSGTYYLRFEDDTAPLLNSPGVIGAFGYILTPASPAPLDVRIDSSIGAPKNTYLYRLDGDTGRRLTLSAYWGYRNTYFGTTDGGLVGQGSLRLIGPDGSILAAPPIDRYSQGSGTQTILHHFSSLNDFVLPQTGTYFVEVSGLSQTVGSFSLGINNPLENFQTLSQSVPTTTVFGVRGDIQEWSFSATAGQAVGWTYQGDVPIRSWSISSSTGIVAQGAGGSIVTMAFTPTSSGTYYLRFEDDAAPLLTSPGVIGPFGYVLMPADVTPPTSKVTAMPPSAPGLQFTVSVSAQDLVGSNNATPSGVTSIDIYVAIDRGAFQYWTTTSATSPSALFTGLSNRTYWFYSRARDQNGNTEIKAMRPEAYTVVGDFDAPISEIIHVAVDDASGLMEVTSAGSDSGGAGLSTMEHWVSIDGGPAQIFANTPSGARDTDGLFRVSSGYQGLRDGVAHTYRFYSIGRDRRGNMELPPQENSQDVAIERTFSPIVQLLPTAIDVQRGASQRSFIRYVDITFNSEDPAALQQLVTSGRIRLERFEFSASLPAPGTGQNVSLQATQLAIIGNRIHVDFGLQGIGGNRNSSVGDGFYQFVFDIDGDANYSDARFGFFRMFGDTSGDGLVNATDIALQRMYFGEVGPNLEGDLNGDGVVNSLDLQVATRESRMNKRLNSILLPFIND